MRQRVVFHYFLYLAIILGVFASMAQNDYGLTLVSWACYLFAGSLAIEVIKYFKNKAWHKMIELIGLATLFVLFGLRAAYIYFANIEWMLLIACTTLVIVYAVHAIEKSKKIGIDSSRLRMLILTYYASISAYLLSIVGAILFPELSEPIGMMATALLVLFIIGSYLSGKLLVNGVETEAFIYLKKQSGHSIILIVGFSLITFYSGLSMIGFLPPLYTNKIPKTYIELINKAETGKEITIDGFYKHELYKKAYDDFIKKMEEQK